MKDSLTRFVYFRYARRMQAWPCSRKYRQAKPQSTAPAEAVVLVTPVFYDCGSWDNLLNQHEAAKTVTRSECICCRKTSFAALWPSECCRSKQQYQSAKIRSHAEPWYEISNHKFFSECAIDIYHELHIYTYKHAKDTDINPHSVF